MARSIFLLVFLFGAHAIYGQENLKKEIDKILKYETQHIDIAEYPELSILMIDGDSTFIVNYTQSEINIAPDDPLELGSATKPFTSALILSLMEENKLSMKDSIVRFIPEVRNTSLSDGLVSDLIYELYDFPKIPDNLGASEVEKHNPYKYYQKEKLISFLKSQTFNKSKKSTVSYIPYALLEYIITSVTNEDIETSIQKYLCSNLGLKNTSYLNQPIQGHRRDGQESAVMEYASFKTAIGLHSSINDMARFLSAQWDHPTFGKLLEGKEKTDLARHIYRSMGWLRLEDIAKYDIYGYSGGSNGHRVEIAFIPDTRTAVVVASTSSAGTQALPYHILRMINQNWKKKHHGK